MTLAQLTKQLQRLVDKGHGRTHVVINKSTFKNNLEADGCCMFDIEAVHVGRWIILDENGYHIHADEQEHWREGIVLTGDCAPAKEPSR